jgi:hypothetical protein
MLFLQEIRVEIGLNSFSPKILKFNFFTVSLSKSLSQK